MLRIGVCFSLTAEFLAQLIGTFGAAHPNVHVAFVQGGTGEHLLAIHRGDIDVAFLADVPAAAGYDGLTLWDEQIYVALAEADELAARSEVHWDDLHDSTFVVSDTLPGPEYHRRLVKRLGGPDSYPTVQMHSLHRDALMHLVAADRKVKLTSEATIAIGFPGIVYRPLADEKLTFSAVWSSKNGNPPLRRLLSLARSMMTGGVSRTPDRSP